MLVAPVPAPRRPAWATVVASRSWCGAVSTSCGTPRRLSIRDRISDFSTLVVPTSTGWPASCRSAMSSTHASNLAWAVWKMTSASSLRIIGMLVGIGTTPSL